MFLQPPVHARTHDVLVTAYRNLGRRKKPHGECEDQPMALREKGSGEDVGWYQPKRSLLLGGAQRAPALGSRDSKTGPEHLHEIRNRIISTRSVKGMRRAHEQRKPHLPRPLDTLGGPGGDCAPAGTTWWPLMFQALTNPFPRLS